MLLGLCPALSGEHEESFPWTGCGCGLCWSRAECGAAGRGQSRLGGCKRQQERLTLCLGDAREGL